MAATLRPYLDRLMSLRAALTDLRPAVEAGDPWPLAERFGVEPEASWGPPEILAHVGEMLPYWYGQIESILEGGAAPVPFGRSQEDPARIAAIGRNRTLSSAHLFDRIESGIQPYWWLLPRLSEADVTHVGLHPKRGVMTIPEILDALVIGHAEGHVSQLREALPAI